MPRARNLATARKATLAHLLTDAPALDGAHGGIQRTLGLAVFLPHDLWLVKKGPHGCLRGSAPPRSVPAEARPPYSPEQETASSFAANPRSAHNRAS